jgi:hypothetical protein
LKPARPAVLRGERLEVAHLFGTGRALGEMRRNLAAAIGIQTAIDERLDLGLLNVIVGADAERFVKRARCRRRVASCCDPAPAVAATREMVGERHEGLPRQLPELESLDVDVCDVSRWHSHNPRGRNRRRY